MFSKVQLVLFNLVFSKVQLVLFNLVFSRVQIIRLINAALVNLR